MPLAGKAVKKPDGTAVTRLIGLNLSLRVTHGGMVFETGLFGEAPFPPWTKEAQAEAQWAGIQNRKEPSVHPVLQEADGILYYAAHFRSLLGARRSKWPRAIRTP
ncbi:MAG: hypothetical protein GX162_06815 [Firmicutes bacterium]|nr:hypothetical protein [Bacillota bacterium]